tara:strand:- start:329 stop:682 length:354 start_codon:yes stop_codon:yes gene_type:complete
VSKAKQKGTQGENEILEMLIAHGNLDAKRTSAGMESHDIWLGDIVVEVKFRKSWRLFQWVQKVRRVSVDDHWAIFAIHGDRRSAIGKDVGKVAVLDAEFAAELLTLWRHWKDKDKYL